MASCKGVLAMDPMATSATVQMHGEQPALVDSTLSGGQLAVDLSMEDIDPDMAEVYFLVMHFLAGGPCQRAFFQLWNELLQHKLLPRRFHAWYSRSGMQSGDENDDGVSYPLSYTDIVARHPNIEQGHLVKLLKQLLIYNRKSVAGQEPRNSRIPTAADVPTLLGTGEFSLVESERSKAPKEVSRWTQQLRWPHWQADQVHGLMLRELGGGFARHHRGTTIRTASYVVTKPAILVDRIQIIKKLRGHRNAVYCAIFDNTGQYVITGSDDRLVKIWSTETGLCLRSCRGHEGDITDMAVSSRNSLVASASNDHSIRVWGLPNGIPVSVLRGHSSAVTAIAFSPRQGCEHLLLSTSDDGTCRIWNAKDSTLNSRLYMPNPRDIPPGISTSCDNSTLKGTGGPTPPVAPASNSVLCCAFNADGSIFVTGSSDKMARVWDARKWNDDVTGRPNYELDTLRGHENDVNYVQFSGCAALGRSSSPAEIGKDDSQSNFRNSWFAHDSIVTCSRDGSAIIWTPRPRRYHGKVGKWQKAYHLKVPPPPMPPQPPRGNGPRQRLLPTPRGVNMIVWSLDNRFVLAAIMDHRICVWNAVDGSLVHSLTGHDKQTFVLDVHPFNPRIAMSAGYDGRVIIWDIWEGHPIKVYETGDFTLVDGNFSPDGASLVVSDEVGQIYIFGTGPEMSSKDVMYDQFFLGDFRSLFQDTHGNVLDAETQLAPHRRNVQDLLCDSNLIPYPEPYQSIYQQRRLGALGIEWNPPSVQLAIGTSDDAVFTLQPDHIVQLPPATVPSALEHQEGRNVVSGGGNRWVEQPSEAEEAMDWEQEVAGLSEDTGSDYSASEESQSEADGNDQGGDSLDEEEFATHEEKGGDDREGRNLRRSRRNKRKTEEYIHTASGRRVRRRTFNDEDTSEHRPRRRPSRSSRSGLSNVQATQSPVPSRPQRQATRHSSLLPSSYNPSQDDAVHDGRALPLQDSHQLVIEDGSDPDVEEREVSSVNEDADDMEGPAAKTVLGVQVEPIQNVFKEATATISEATDNLVECRRPRSQRRLIVKLRSDGAGPSAMVPEGLGVDLNANGVHNIDGTARSSELASGAADLSKEVPTISSLDGPSQHTMRKLVVKPPIRPVNKVLEPGVSQFESEIGNTDAAISGSVKSLVVDSDEEFLHDERRKWEWKKAKAAKRARGSSSPDLAVPDGRSCRHKDIVIPTLPSTRDRSSPGPVVHPSHVQAPDIHEQGESDDVVSRGKETRGLSASLPGPCVGAEDHSMKKLANGHVNKKDEDCQPAENLKVTCVENKGSEASMEYMDLPKWRQARQAGPCTRQRTQNAHSELSKAHTELHTTTSSLREEHKKRSSQTEVLGPNVEESEEDIEMEANENELENEGTGQLLLEESDAELALSEKAESLPNCSEDEDGGDSLLSLKDTRLRSREQEGSLNDNSDTDGPPPIKNMPFLRTKKSEEESMDEEEEDLDSEQVEDEDEGYRDSDVYEDTQASTHEWSDSEKESDNDGMDVRRKITRPKRQRALGELDSYAQQASTSYPSEQSNIFDISTGKRRIRNMKSVLSESGRETRTRSSKRSTCRRSKATVPASNGQGNRGVLVHSRQNRRKAEHMSNNGMSSWRSSGRQPFEYEGTQSGSDIERTLRTSRRSRGVSKQDLRESNADSDRNSNYDSGEAVLRQSTSRGKQDPERKGKGKTISNVGNGLPSSAWGQRGRRKIKPGSRNLESVAWLLMEEVEPGTRFIPQFGDEVVYLRQGHQDFLEESHMDEKGPWKLFKNPVRAVEYCRIVELDYVMDQESSKISCKLVLEFIDSGSRVNGKTFKLTLPELTNHPDFLVERSRFDASLKKVWSPRDHCQVWWASGEDDGKTGSWWDGRIKQIKAKSKEFPSSPWEMYHVTYKSGSTEVTPHSPWELFDKDYKIAGWELPSMPASMKEAILSAMNDIERASFKVSDPYGVEQHREDVKDNTFLSRAPLPLSFDNVWVRVEKNYYHSREAFEHDVRLLIANTVLFYGNDSEEVSKMEKLSERLTEALYI